MQLVDLGARGPTVQLDHLGGEIAAVISREAAPLGRPAREGGIAKPV